MDGNCHTIHLHSPIILDEYKWLFTFTHLKLHAGKSLVFLLTAINTIILQVLKHSCFTKDNMKKESPLWGGRGMA